MWFDSTADILEAMKGSLPFTFLVCLPFLLIISPVNGAQSFPVYRVNQFDLAGNTYGSRSTLVNMEARSLGSASLMRKCVVARLSEITLSSYRSLMDQNAGALLIMLPSELGNLSAELQQQFVAIENVMLTEETILPVYFAIENSEVSDIYDSIRSATTTDSAPTATGALLQSISANGFQMMVNIHASKKMEKYKTINLHGVLEGSGNADRLPTVLIVAHYDTMAVAPGLAYGADSNGSGVAALLELMRVFSRLYNSASRPDYNLAFLLTGAAKLNYFGTKKWLEEMKESNKFPYLNEVESVLCLDSLGKEGSEMYVHVSKPPREGTTNHEIYQKIEELAKDQKITVELVHKKIHLGEIQLAWEHEQFAMSKLAGMTISSTNSHKSPLRTSALDTLDKMSQEALSDKVKLIGEALARHMFVLPESNGTVQQIEILQHDLAIQPSMISAWLKLITSEPRAAQLINEKSPVISSLEQTFNRYLKSVAKTSYSVDKRDPEFVLYDSSIETMHVYNVKPAVFDLVLALVIVGYLGVFYLLSEAYPAVATALMNKPKKA